MEKITVYRPEVCIIVHVDDRWHWNVDEKDLNFIPIVFIKTKIEKLSFDILMFVNCTSVNYWLAIYNTIDCGNWTNNLVRIYIPNQHMNQWPTHQWERSRIQSKCRCANWRKVLIITIIEIILSIKSSFWSNNFAEILKLYKDFFVSFFMGREKWRHLIGEKLRMCEIHKQKIPLPVNLWRDLIYPSTMQVHMFSKLTQLP